MYGNTILLYCLQIKIDTESKNPRVPKTSDGGQCFYHNVKCAVVKNQDSSTSKKQVGYQTKMSVLGDVFFWNIKMNTITNKFFLAGDTFILEMHSKKF